jgi:Ni,Fe-hydrogenase maturation factor
MTPAFSTHMLPLRVFCEYLTKITRAKIMLLLIQPRQIDFGEGLSKEVEDSAQEIVGFLFEILP